MTVDIEKEVQSLREDRPPAKKDEIFDLVGGDGLWQRCIFLVTVFFAIPSATHNLSMSFLAPNLDHWCAKPEGLNWTDREWKEMAIPPHDSHCSRYKNISENYPFEDSNMTYRSEETIACDSWEYDTSFYSSTVLNQWDLVCDKEWLVSLSKSVYMAGTFASNLVFGQLADTLGRRPIITVSAAIALFSAVICAFSTSFMMFIVTRFFVALGLSGIYNISFVLLMEIVGPEERSIYGIAMNFGWCIGFVSLPGIAYLLRDWFWIQIALTAPCLVLLLCWWMLPESPRWLMSKGRVDEALKTLTKAAKTNKKNLSDIDARLKKMMARATEVHEAGETSGTYFDLLRTPGLWQMTLNIYLLWFVNAFVYYGLSYNTNELAGNPFVNFAICGAVEFPAYFFTIFAIRYIGRKVPLITTMVIGGAACILMYPLPEDPWWLGVSVSMIGKFCITCSFAITFIFTAEIFPTIVRNIGLGSASVFARFGSIMAPFVRELGHATHPFVPQLAFGILAVASGLMVLLLPETMNVTMPETVAEAASRNKPRKCKEKKKLNHVDMKLLNGDIEKDCVEDDDGLTTLPKPQQNGKKLDVLPEEDVQVDCCNGTTSTDVLEEEDVQSPIVQEEDVDVAEEADADDSGVASEPTDIEDEQKTNL